MEGRSALNLNIYSHAPKVLFKIEDICWLAQIQPWARSLTDGKMDSRDIGGICGRNSGSGSNLHSKILLRKLPTE